jgi:hypothetical protein
MRWILERADSGWSCMDWTDLAQDKDHCKAVVNMVINVLVPQNLVKFFNSFFKSHFICNLYYYIQQIVYKRIH